MYLPVPCTAFLAAGAVCPAGPGEDGLPADEGSVAVGGRQPREPSPGSRVPPARTWVAGAGDGAQRQGGCPWLARAAVEQRLWDPRGDPRVGRARWPSLSLRRTGHGAALAAPAFPEPRRSARQRGSSCGVTFCSRKVTLFCLR